MSIPSIGIPSISIPSIGIPSIGIPSISISIFSIFNLAKLNESKNKSKDSDNNEDCNSSKEAGYEFGDVVAQLREDLLKNEKVFTAFEYNKKQAIYEYFIRLYEGHRKLKASKIVAGIVGP
ncbi:hypothetical protein F8M41_020476 [Gigaspora margarita]|uniref:Uncharacterized protein n=1 Tax=Gigaspora margarita TaxID=4874 RepID=A0A8H4AID1_GIGMA|nr:hypothetical protein F8M41_020476 [Gigaspora margarita]